MKKILTLIIILVCCIVGPAWGYDATYFYNLGLDSTMSNTKINYFTRAIELNPELSAAYEERGMLYYFQEHYAEMIRDFLKVTKLSPDHANGYAMLGVAMMAAIFLVLIFKLTLPAPKKKKWPDWWNRNK